MQDKIFVYGSLMAPVASRIGQTLRANTELLGEARVSGLLFDLGRYPGLVLSENKEEQVRGHLLRIHDPFFLLPILDEYEGSAGGDPEKQEYRRAIIAVDRQGQNDEAWTYLYNLPVDGLPLIPNGDYLAFLAGNESYRRFLDSV